MLKVAVKILQQNFCLTHLASPSYCIDKKPIRLTHSLIFSTFDSRANTKPKSHFLSTFQSSIPKNILFLHFSSIIIDLKLSKTRLHFPIDILLVNFNAKSNKNGKYFMSFCILLRLSFFTNFEQEFCRYYKRRMCYNQFMTISIFFITTRSTNTHIL